MIPPIIKHNVFKKLEPICVLPWQPFFSNSCMATVSGHFTFFEIKNIKFQYYFSQYFSQIQKYWEKFTFVNNSLVRHQLLTYMSLVFKLCVNYARHLFISTRGQRCQPHPLGKLNIRAALTEGDQLMSSPPFSLISIRTHSFVNR